MGIQVEISVDVDQRLEELPQLSFSFFQDAKKSQFYFSLLFYKSSLSTLFFYMQEYEGLVGEGYKTIMT